MTVAVHKPFPLNGRKIEVGSVLFGADAEQAMANPILARRCTRVPDEVFAHLIVTPDNSAIAPPPVPKTEAPAASRAVTDTAAKS